MNRTVLLARLWELCERLTDPEDVATLLVAIAVIEAGAVPSAPDQT